jgi:hypothetical protein
MMTSDQRGMNGVNISRRFGKMSAIPTRNERHHWLESSFIRCLDWHIPRSMQLSFRPRRCVSWSMSQSSERIWFPLLAEAAASVNIRSAAI